MCFVDFAADFDPVERDSLWRIIMAAGGMCAKFVRLIRAYYASTKTRARASGGNSLSFEVRSGVRQECTLSPILFNNIIDWIFGQALQSYSGVRLVRTSTLLTQLMPTILWFFSDSGDAMPA